MKNLKLNGAKPLSKEQQKDVNGGKTPLVFMSAKRRGCNPALSCCYHNGTTWVQGPPCF
ncbi:hypothetical protein [Aquimarina sediminis]|uniref:hypothetical protein n=1 Tax=Aquimarina sediminis TaxID=2070536 RepID=UPI0013E8C5BF|nr:hypothetical protein [Aquimarina sediminis]